MPGEDLCEGVDQAAVLFTSSSPLLECQHVEATVQQTAIVGKLGFDFFSEIPARPELVDGDGRDVVEKLGVFDLIYPTAFALHRVKVYRQAATRVG